MESVQAQPNSDQDLLVKYRSTQNQEFLAVLYNRYSHLVLGSCINYLKDKNAAEDAVMDVYIHLKEALLQHEVVHFKSWLYRTVSNHCLMILRKNKNNVEVRLDDKKMGDQIMENPSFIHLNNEQQEKEDDLHQAIDQLNPEQQTCIKLFFFDKKSYREITEITDYSENQVKSFIQNGKRNLKNILTHSSSQ